ncbi:MAG: integrase core domain-containing protein [Patescibacteria group bacterium]
MDAYEIKRSTLFLWRQKLKQERGKLESLNNRSRKPQTVRHRRISPEIEQYILHLRTTHPRLGKEKISVLLKDFCLKNKIENKYSASTVGRILLNLKTRKLLPAYVKLSLNGRTGKLHLRQAQKRLKLRIKHYQPRVNDNLVQVDTIIKFIHGVKRYLITAINPETDFAFAYAYKAHASLTAADFFQKLQIVAPFRITHVQTDNGSEFEKCFRQYMRKQKIVHFHNYPRCPKMNAFVERFNRTIQEEFSNFNRILLATDLNRFNSRLIEWLVWYNCERPHHSLNLRSPMQFIISNLTTEKSNMLWTNTLSCVFFKIMLFYYQ